MEVGGAADIPRRRGCFVEALVGGPKRGVVGTSAVDIHRHVPASRRRPGQSLVMSCPGSPPGRHSPDSEVARAVAKSKTPTVGQGALRPAMFASIRSPLHHPMPCRPRPRYSRSRVGSAESMRCRYNRLHVGDGGGCWFMCDLTGGGQQILNAPN